MRSGFVLLLIAGLCVISGFLIKQNRDLKTVIARMDKQQFLQLGDQVRPFAGIALSGLEQNINYAKSSKTVLMVFQPLCPACERTVPYWRAIEAAARTDEFQVFGVTLGDGPRSSEFLASSGMNLETLVEIDAGTKALYKLNLTPLTIVVDSSGKVEKIWPGAFNRETKPDVERYFGISVADDGK